MLWQHGLPNHPDELVAQRVEVGLVAQLGRERFEGLRRIVLAAVEATVHETLYPTTQRVEQGRDHERGGHDH